VKVVCQDARAFQLEDHENDVPGTAASPRSPTPNYVAGNGAGIGGADLITLSYSLSMIVSRMLVS